jgi:hypothetical protein
VSTLTPAPLIADVAGYYAPFDGGGGRYYYDPTDSSTPDNGGTVIAPTSAGGRWKLLPPYEISVKTFGAKGDGATSDTAAFTAAYNASAAGGEILVPPPSASYVVGAMSAGKNVVWKLLYDPGNVNLLSLPGSVVMDYAGALGVFRMSSPPTDYATVRIDRTASGSGGTGVNSTLVVNTTTLAGVKSYSWGITSVVNDNNPGSDGAQNVAVYGAARKNSNGFTWGSCFEIRDNYTDATGNAQGNAIGQELTLYANSASSDTNFQRVGLNVAGHIQNGSSATEWARAIWTTSDANFRYREVFSNQGHFSKAVLYNNASGITTSLENPCFVRDDGSAYVGIDLSRASYSGSGNTAILLASNHVIRFGTATNPLFFGYFPSSARLAFSGAVVSMGSGWEVTGALRTTSATGGSVAVPSLASGFLTFYIDGYPYKLPYYNA